MTTRTQDRFLNGRVTLDQPADGYRAGLDAVLLAASLPANADEDLIEFGCGAGAALICAASRLDTGRFRGIEADPGMADLARANVAQNGLANRVEITTASILSLAEGQSSGSGTAHQVFFNPPFFDDERALRAPKPGKQRAWLSGDAPLADWIAAASCVLRGRGHLTLIHRADKLADILAALSPRFGSVVVKPIHPRAGLDAKRVIVSARLGGRAPLRLLSPLILHGDGPEMHTPEADAILRGEAVIDMR